MPEITEPVEMTDAEIAELFGPIVDKLSTIVRGRFDEDLSLGEELRALLAEHNLTHRRVADAIATPLSYVTTIVKAAQNVADWDAALSKRQNVAKHGLVAVYLRGAGRQTSASGLNKFVTDMVAYTDAVNAPKLTGAKLVADHVSKAVSKVNHLFADLTPKQRRDAVAKLIEELEAA